MMLSERETMYLYVSIVLLSSIAYLVYDYLDTYSSGVRIKVWKRGSAFSPSACIFIIISLLVALIPLINRNCGTDTPNYYRSYSNPYRQSHDVLFYYIFRILNHFTSDPKTGIGIIGLITIAPLVIVISKKSHLYVRWLVILSYMTTLYFYDYNYTRMMMASTIIIIAYSYLLDHNKKTGLILLGISVLLHQSSIIVFAVYFIALFLIKYRKILVLTTGALVFMFIRNPGYFFEFVTYDRYTSYIEMLNVDNVTLGIGTTIIAIPLLLILIYYNKKIEDRYIYNLFFISIIFNVSVSVLGYYISVASRISKMCFTMNSLYMVPYILKNVELSDNEKKMLYFFQICYCFLMFFMLQKSFKYIGIMPYY